jgi:TRAP-type C4-dicarboxylate transport system substrate-binding protein
MRFRKEVKTGRRADCRREEVKPLIFRKENYLMKRKKLVLLLGITAVILSISLIVLTPEDSRAEWDGVTLKVCSSFPPPDVAMPTYIAKIWEEEVTKRTGGKVKFKNYWGGVL